MRPIRHAAPVVFAVLLAVSGCAEVKKRSGLAKSALGVLEAIPETRVSALKISDYSKLVDKFRKFHDSGEFAEEDVLDVLRTTGVLGGRPSQRSSVPGKSSPPPVPAPTEKYDGPFRWPLDAGVVSSEYGSRWGKSHKGLDIAADMGVPVKAAAAGTVLYSGSGMRGYGNALIVRHDEKLTTLYAHNKELLAKVGDRVEQGQTIALLGSTGRSTGPHVHFEIREGEQAISPRTRLPKGAF